MIFSLLTILHISAQNIDGIPLKDLKEEYIQINPWGMAGRKIYVNLDHGQPKKPGEFGDQRIRDEDDKPLQFHSMIHAINFMKGFGYELFEIYSTGSDGDINPKYILSKQKME